MSGLFLREAGAVTALGLDLNRTISSLRAGFDAFRCVPFRGLTGRDLQAAPICGFAEGLGGAARYLALIERAIEPCLLELSEAARRRTAIIVGLPRPNRPGSPARLPESLLGPLASALRVQPAMLHFVPLGRAAVFAGFARARNLLASTNAESCVVGGVDVLTNGDSLRALAHERLIKEDWDGLIPGEGAAFVRVTSEPGNGSWGSGCVCLKGVAAATEAARGTKDDPVIGRAVAAAFRSAMKEAELNDTDVNLYINDVNGVRVAFEDHALGVTRYLRTPDHTFDVWHVASHLGETGAACGGIQLAWAQAALELGFAPGHGILLSASDGDLRVAAVIQHSQEPDVQPSMRQVSVGQMRLHDSRSSGPHSEKVLVGLALPTDGLHQELTARHLGELAWLWSVRAHHLQETDSPWADIHGYEERLLPHIDALAWAMPEDGSQGLRTAWNSDDEMAVAAAALVLLSTPLSPTQMRAVVEKARNSPVHQHALASVIPHLPHSEIASILRSLTSDGTAALYKLALRAIAVAQHAEGSLIESALASRDSSVVASAIRCAGVLGARRHVDLILERLRDAFRRRIDLTLGGSTKVALLSLGLSGSEVVQLTPERLVHDAPIAAALSCLRDNRSFSVLVRDAAMSLAIVEACGWSGELTFVQSLLELLSSDDYGPAAAESLYRISGLRVTPSGRVKAHSGEPLSLDADAWYRALRSSGLNTRSGRLRHGVLWHRRSAIDHLRRLECPASERLTAAWEHAVIHGSGFPTHPEQFVRAQRAALDALHQSP